MVSSAVAATYVAIRGAVAGKTWRATTVAAGSFHGIDDESRMTRVAGRWVCKARVALRFSAIVCWTLPIFGVYLLVLPLDIVRPQGVRSIRRFFQHWWARGVCWIMGMRVVRRGTPPARPFILVANHLSYTDIIVLTREAPCVFIAMAEIDGWPVFGYMARKVGTVFINRQRLKDTQRVNAAIGDLLDQGEGVVLFAESTTSAGNGVLPFKSALFETAVQRRIPVHYAVLHYEVEPPGPPASRSVCWVDDTPFLVHALQLFKVKRYTATVTFGETAVAADDRRVLARLVQAEVENLLEPIL